MKPKLYSQLLFTMFLGLCACSTTSSDKADADADEWKEMDEFHLVMADVFHPLKDSGNLEPIRAQAEDLAASAAKWANATLPNKVDNDDVRTKLSALRDGTRELADQVKIQAPDSVLGSRLTDLHDQFHELQEAWYHDGGHHQH